MKTSLFVIVLSAALIGLLMIGRSRPVAAVESAAVVGVPMDDRVYPPERIYPPGREPIAYPTNYRTDLVHFLTVDRADAITRNVFISPAAVEAAQRGDPIPDGTITVIEGFDAARDVFGGVRIDERGRLVPGELRADELHVGERRSTWRIEDLHAASHLGGWNFRAFDFNNGQPVDRDLNDCFSCHDGASEREFLFTRGDLGTFARTGEVQYVYCPLPGRAPCR